MPKNWRQLQNWVADIFSECGFRVHVEKSTTLARGRAAIDVSAVETVKNRDYKVLVECKNWTAKVPQNVVHGFRTVVTDAGANIGYVVSKRGFQSGANSAANFTNVKLVTVEQFQLEFVDQWYSNYFADLIVEHFRDLDDYLDQVCPPEWVSKLGDAENARFWALSERHTFFRVLYMHFHPAFSFGQERVRVNLPLMAGNNPDLSALDREQILNVFPQSLREVTTYREFFDELRRIYDPVHSEFERLRTGN